MNHTAFIIHVFCLHIPYITGVLGNLEWVHV